jgi:hypothetical protein
VRKSIDAKWFGWPLLRRPKLCGHSFYVLESSSQLGVLIGWLRRNFPAITVLISTILTKPHQQSAKGLTSESSLLSSQTRWHTSAFLPNRGFEVAKQVATSDIVYPTSAKRAWLRSYSNKNVTTSNAVALGLYALDIKASLTICSSMLQWMHADQGILRGLF